MTANIVKRYKLVILGDTTVGKSAIIASYTKGKFVEQLEPTLVATYASLCLNAATKFEAWELAGEQRWHGLASIYYENAQAALIVFDIQDPQSFLNALKWIKELKKFNKKLLIALAANKIDLWNIACIDIERVRAYAAKNDFIFMETSAKTGMNIKELFAAIAAKLEQHRTTKRIKKSFFKRCIFK